jgi:hypothetical protein
MLKVLDRLFQGNYSTLGDVFSRSYLQYEFLSTKIVLVIYSIMGSQNVITYSNMIQQDNLELMRWTCIREVLDSNHARTPANQIEVLSWLSLVNSAICKENTYIRPRPLPSKNFPIRQSSCHPKLHSLETESIVK